MAQYKIVNLAFKHKHFCSQTIPFLFFAVRLKKWEQAFAVGLIQFLLDYRLPETR
jgi:hypothetical protein